VTPPAEIEEGHRVRCRITELLDERSMTLTELADRVGVSIVNLSVLKNDRAKAVRFSTLTAICEVLECDVGDVLVLSD
jgi:putative transcriptional regulator